METFTIVRTNGDLTVVLPTPQTYFYRFVCIPTAKSYIGRTNSPVRRIQEHLSGSGSPLLLQALVDYGLSSFTIELLDSSNAPELLDIIEDHYIKKYDSLHPNGFNLRMNLPIVKNDDPFDLNKFTIDAKFVFKRNNNSYFSIGEFTQARSFQVLTNVMEAIGANHNLKKKKTNIYRYFELGLYVDIVHTPGEIYHLTINYNPVYDDFTLTP